MTVLPHHFCLPLGTTDLHCRELGCLLAQRGHSPGVVFPHRDPDQCRCLVVRRHSSFMALHDESVRVCSVGVVGTEGIRDFLLLWLSSPEPNRFCS